MKGAINMKSIENQETLKEVLDKGSQGADKVNLICKWEQMKDSVENGIVSSVRLSDSGKCSLDLELVNADISDEQYEKLLQAKVYEIFGVININVALNSFYECVNLIYKSENPGEMSPEESKERFRAIGNYVLSFFKEIRPRDSIELMLVTKMIMLNKLSNTEFIKGVSNFCEHTRSSRQNRGIKASRLFLEFKEKLDKHRRPEQRINVQHNHIHNEGQAIIGNQISSRDR